MRHAIAPVAALLFGVSILLTGQGLQGTLLPVRATLEAFSTLSIGGFGAAYFLGFTLGCLRGGELVGRVGHVRVFLAMTALGSSAPLIHGLVLDPPGRATTARECRAGNGPGAGQRVDVAALRSRRRGNRRSDL